VQVLEADYLDSGRDGLVGREGGLIIQGVEFDAIGRRVAYWLFPEHPGSARGPGESKRIPASEVLHLYRQRRPGEVRGVSWYGAAIVPLKDLDEYEDAELIKQKIAACFAAFVTDLDGFGSPVGEETSDPLVEVIEPGMVHKLPPGKTVTFGTPPAVVESTVTTRNQRKIAAALGVTYESLTGDYSQVNFSSARMGRIEFQGNVHRLQYNLLIPQLCAVVWQWVMGAAVDAGLLREVPEATWTPPPLPLLDPEKEAGAMKTLIRIGAKTLSEMVREQGGDPETHFAEYAEDMTRLDKLGLKLDSDPRATNGTGAAQPGPVAADSNEPPPLEEAPEP
jgi:lambda family phage portal protein